MCAAPKFNTLTHENLARARVHRNNSVERQTNEFCEPVLTNTRNLRLDGGGFNLFQSLIKGLRGQSSSTTERLQRHDHVQAEQLRLLMLVEIHRESVRPTANQIRENAAPMATTPPEGTSCSRRKIPQWHPHLHTPKLLWDSCGRARGLNVAFPSNLKWHSPASRSDVQQRDVPHGPRSVTAIANPTHGVRREWLLPKSQTGHTRAKSRVLGIWFPPASS